MNFKRWKFSKQVQPELEKFIKIVENNRNREKVDKLYEEILPKLPLSYYDLESSKVESHDDIITIDSDDDDISKKETPNTSKSLNLTNVSILIPDEKTIENEIDKFKSTLQECLNDNRLLENEDIQGIFNNLNNESLTELINFLYENVNDFGLLNLGEVLNKNSFNEDVVRGYMKLILLKKLLKTESTIIFMPIVSTFVKNYPSIFREVILLSLLNEHLEHVHIFEQIYKLLPQYEKDLFIREFLFSCQELEEGHLLILQPIVPQLTEFAIKQRLINLMSISADSFKENKIFMKMLIELIKTLNKDFIELEPVLYSIIEKNKTIFKGTAEKALNLWFSNCDTQ